MRREPVHVLFVCTGNSARSILAEALLNHLGEGRFRAFSAGSHPTGKVNPQAVATLARMGVSTEGLRSKAWDEFARSGAPRLDFVITVCDHAAHEVCPVWPGRPANAHWGVPDPAVVTGTEEEIRAAFEAAAATLRHRIERLVRLSLDKMDPEAAQEDLRCIGRS